MSAVAVADRGITQDHGDRDTIAWAKAHVARCPHCGSDDWNIVDERRGIHSLCSGCVQLFQLDDSRIRQATTGGVRTAQTTSADASRREQA